MTGNSKFCGDTSESDYRFMLKRPWTKPELLKIKSLSNPLPALIYDNPAAPSNNRDNLDE